MNKCIKWGTVSAVIYVLVFFTSNIIFNLKEQPGVGIYIGLPLGIYTLPFVLFNYIFKITDNIGNPKMLSYSYIGGAFFYFLLGCLVYWLFRKKRKEVEKK